MNSETAPEPNSHFLPRLLRFLNLLEGGLLAILLSTMIIVSATQILLRNVFETSITWGDPLLRMMVLWVGLLGAMVATRENNHISIDILSRYLSRRVNIASQLITDLFTSFVCALLAYHGARFVMQDHEANVIAFADIPAWFFELIIPVGFGVISLRYLVRLASGIRGMMP